MALRKLGFIDLPKHIDHGVFDHADIHTARGLLYVAHMANDAVDVIDCNADRYLRSIPGLPGVAGVLVYEPGDMVFTSNRGETTVGIFNCGREEELVKVDTGNHSNGLAHDPERQLLLGCNINKPYTVSVVDVRGKALIKNIPVLERTRWAMYDAGTKSFYFNIGNPAAIGVIDCENPTEISRYINVPATGAHGLALDSEKGLLFCACDNGKMFSMDIVSGKVLKEMDLSGSPDTIFYHKRRNRIYAAIGSPGLIDVIDTQSMQRIETVATENGAHTMALNTATDKLYAFLPETYRAMVFIDE
jgi:DNA-binding beta-propeller fold protein YncE